MKKVCVFCAIFALSCGLSARADEIVTLDSDPSNGGLEVLVEFLGLDDTVAGQTTFTYRVTDLGTPDLSNISFIFECPGEENDLVLLSVDPEGDIFPTSGGNDNPQIPDGVDEGDFNVKFDVGSDFVGEISFTFEGELGLGENDAVGLFAKGGQENAMGNIIGPACDDNGGGVIIPTPSAAAMGVGLILPILFGRRRTV